jgi:hypothetical protein
MNDPHLPELSSEELANRLDEVLGSDETQSSAAKPNDPRIDIALTFANASHPEMSPEMLARIQSKVLDTHRQQFRQKQISRSRYPVVLRWASAAAMFIVFFGAAAMPSVASSVPGEVWYPLKRNIESIELVFASSSVSRAEVHLTQAERRINEVQILLQQRVFDANLMIDARHSLADFENVAADLLPRDESRAAWVSESIAILLQDAQQMGIISEAEVVALLPTVIPISTEAPTSTPTVVISPTATATNTLIPTVSPTAVVPASLTPSPLPTTVSTQIVQSVTTDTEEPSPTATDTATLMPTVSNTPLPTATATSLSPVTTMYVVEKANVRQQPARNQAVIAVIEQGTAVEVIGEDDTNSWWNVKLQDGTIGWVAKFLLSNELPTPAAGNDSSNSGDFGCEHPGDYCNAPGQTGTQPTPVGGNPSGNPPGGGPPENPPGGGSPSNPGSGNGGKP